MEDIQPSLSEQRIKHIVDSYLLMGDEAAAFEKYLRNLLNQYPPGLIELALVDSLIKNWLTIPMKKGLSFLDQTYRCIQRWQRLENRRLEEKVPLEKGQQLVSFTPSQFTQITGLDPQLAFSVLEQPLQPSYPYLPL